MIKILEEVKVTQMDNSNFVTDEKLYRFSRKGLPVMLLPHGSLIFLGEKVQGPGGFLHAVFGVWKGKDQIEKRKLLCVRQDRVLEKHKANKKGKCEFYPSEDDDCVCACGSDVSGPFVCTKEYSLSCQWAIEERRKKGVKDA